MTGPITLTHLGHSCVLLELPRQDGTPAKILLDPGNLTPRVEPIAGLDAILVTHAHPDHIDPEQVRRLRADGSVPVYGDAATVKVLEDAGLGDAFVVSEDTTEVAGVDVTVSVGEHEEIYPGVPLPVNFGYLIAGRIFAPGDAFAVPESPVDVLLLPTGAPWMKLAETIDYLKAVSPHVVIPVHDGGLATPHREMHRTLMEKFAPEGTAVRRQSIGEALELG